MVSRCAAEVALSFANMIVNYELINYIRFAPTFHFSLLVFHFLVFSLPQIWNNPKAPNAQTMVSIKAGVVLP